jgi:hypothetical protein
MHNQVLRGSSWALYGSHWRCGALDICGVLDK